MTVFILDVCCWLSVAVEGDGAQVFSGTPNALELLSTEFPLMDSNWLTAIHIYKGNWARAKLKGTSERRPGQRRCWMEARLKEKA